ncbi:MAG: PEP-CTERM sorting domain-containing protein [Okeania sp. SIO3I5]|uniref:PEP-CTERM sorting domain-containing protein n=1 Tax=Okeania sp. SIO3I5 TaxID=2607805 RepID=UPI0013B943BD|nr:PEP-CTERM sorting domain-containing protein [Okeania sp. SIO3I5]NEQ40249.1 PEP-CTERM sorting domain-containing protein [Okeania sp. SIO3I5]
MNLKNQYLQTGTFYLAFLIAGIPAATAASLRSSDVVVIIDESVSMSGEQEWIGNMIPQLDAVLQTQGLTGQRFGLVGFGSSRPDFLGRSVPVGGAKFGTSAEFATATNNLLVSGGFEDGYSAIDFALNNYTFREDAAVSFILVTDEDRDNGNSSLNSTNILTGLQRGTENTEDDILLNAIVNANFVNNAIGVNHEANAYIADGRGGYTSTQLPSLNGIVTSSFFNTEPDYVDLALAGGGAAWNLNQLRTGGLTTTSFTNAFIDINVRDIQQRQAPETKFPPVYQFRFTDIKAVEDDPEGDKFQLAFEVLNWSDQPAAGVRIALNEGTDYFPIIDKRPSFAGAGIDNNGRPNGPDAEPLPGNQPFINTGKVVQSTDTAIQWDASQFDFNTSVNGAIPNRDLLGVGERNTPDACALVPGCEVVGNSNPFFGTPKIADLETVDDGNNVLDGFVVTIDDFDEGEVISFNWNLLGIDGNPIGTPDTGNEYAFGAVNLVRTPIDTDPNADFQIFEQNTGVERSNRLFAQDSYQVTEYSSVNYDTTIVSGFSARNSLATQTINSTGGDEPIALFAGEFSAGITGAFLNPADNIFNSPVNAKLLPKLTPSPEPESVPEPSTMVMVGMAAIALFGYKRQRRS